MSLQDHIGSVRYAALQKELATVETPCVLIDMAIVRNQYRLLEQAFPNAGIYYAVKANPAVPVIEELVKLGSQWDIASRFELDKVMKYGALAKDISFGNTIKKPRDIKYFYEKGVRLFATDCESDLLAIAENALGSDVYVRVLTVESPGSKWPLSRKFGCDETMCKALIHQAKKLGLNPRGVSFHVGSQQSDLESWAQALDSVKDIWDDAARANIQLDLINVGGGFPGRYLHEAPLLKEYADAIYAAIEKRFGKQKIKVILEPGRYMVGDAGILATEVVMVARKSADSPRWVFLDIGKFGGLVESWGESIKYPIYTTKDEDTKKEGVILAGPSCDSADILYEKFKYELPMTLVSGDQLYLVGTGAYTTTYSAVEFNGFPPLAARYFDSEK